MSAGDRSTAKHIVLLGATITGNCGAESMLRAATERIPSGSNRPVVPVAVRVGYLGARITYSTPL